MKIKLLLLFTLLFNVMALAPHRTVKGIVTNPDKMPLAAVKVSVPGAGVSATTDEQGRYSITVSSLAKKLRFELAGYKTIERMIPGSLVLDVMLTNETVAQELTLDKKLPDRNQMIVHTYARTAGAPAAMGVITRVRQHQTEDYNPINENGFQLAARQPVTTFAADVDRAAYSNVRRYLNTGHLPPVDAVRIEEMINYFNYNYPQPTSSHPIAVSTELTDSPWNPGLKLLHIGLQARSIRNDKLPASNLVFLIDVSGSMMDENKLPLLKQAFKLLTDQLRPQDKVAIVTYAGSAGIVLQPTAGSEKVRIKDALDQLEAGGSTAGSVGIETAYELAKKNFISSGNNRVILATDGDFNVGVSSEGELQRLIEDKRKDGIYLSVMGFGMGNYKDSHMETLADKGNGNYAYIDNIHEARKEFVEEFGGTLFTVAKDVKIQIEFNPSKVQAYRLIGYENRALKNEDFNDDRKDAGEMGSAHAVTALYEIVPAGSKSAYLPKLDPLKYQQNTTTTTSRTDEMLTVKIRYKQPTGQSSALFETAVSNNSKAFEKCSENLRFASAVAEFGLLLRESEYKGNATYQHVINAAQNASRQDPEGYRAEFIKLVKTAQLLDHRGETARKE